MPFFFQFRVLFSLGKQSKTHRQSPSFVPVSYLNKLFNVNFTRSICANILESSSNFIIVFTITSLFTSRLNFFLVKVTILVKVNFTFNRVSLTELQVFFFRDETRYLNWSISLLISFTCNWGYLRERVKAFTTIMFFFLLDRRKKKERKARPGFLYF